MFLLSKIATVLLNPLSLFLILVALGTALLFSRWWRSGRFMLAVAVAAAGAVSVLPIGNWLLRPLEDRFPPPALTGKVDGIVILGGFVDPVRTESRGQVSVRGSVERLTEALALARRVPEARLVFTGGSGDPFRQDVYEADGVRRLLDEIGTGLDPARMEYEDRSRNTFENAVLTRDIVRPGAHETWLLVTSASHMPRAMGVFRAAGWPVTAYPVDYTTDPEPAKPGFNPSAGFSSLGNGMREWIGLAYYRLRGWTAEIFPGP